MLVCNIYSEKIKCYNLKIGQTFYVKKYNTYSIKEGFVLYATQHLYELSKKRS